MRILTHCASMYFCHVGALCMFDWTNTNMWYWSQSYLYLLFFRIEWISQPKQGYLWQMSVKASLIHNVLYIAEIWGFVNNAVSCETFLYISQNRTQQPTSGNLSKWSKLTLNLLKKTLVQIPSALVLKSLGGGIHGKHIYSHISIMPRTAW